MILATDEELKAAARRIAKVPAGAAMGGVARVIEATKGFQPATLVSKLELLAETNDDVVSSKPESTAESKLVPSDDMSASGRAIFRNPLRQAIKGALVTASITSERHSPSFAPASR